MKHLFSLKKSAAIQVAIGLGAIAFVIGFQNCTASSNSEPDKVVDANPNNPALDCSANPSDAGCAATTCSFNGNEVAAEASIVAFQNSSTAFGTTCVSETRVCHDGALTGSFAFASCLVDAPNSCLFNGQTIGHAGSVTAYQNSTVPHGSNCVSEVRNCTDGSLDGSYAFASCSVDAPASCLFNGQTVAHGSSEVAFETSTVPFGSSCQQETRACDNGSLSGSFTFGSCNVEAPASCLFNGVTIAHGQNVNAFQASTVAYGSQCDVEVRTCNNGVLSGSNEYASCNVNAPASCLFDGQTIAHGQSLNAYQTANVPYGSQCSSEVRTCDNGTLSGSNAFPSCVIDAPKSCDFNGQTIADSQTVEAYSTATVAFGSVCEKQTRTCSDGTLSGSYAFNTCTVNAAASCDFGGKTIADGASVTAYQFSNSNKGSCSSTQTRTCSNGTLSGSYLYNKCN